MWIFSDFRTSSRVGVCFLNALSEKFPPPPASVFVSIQFCIAIAFHIYLPLKHVLFNAFFFYSRVCPLGKNAYKKLYLHLHLFWHDHPISVQYLLYGRGFDHAEPIRARVQVHARCNDCSSHQVKGMYVCMYACMYVCMYVVCMHVFIFAWLY